MEGDTPWWKRLVAIALLPLLLPLAALSGMRSKPVRRSPAEVVAYLDNFLHDGGKPHDWDDFTSVTIADPELDSLRARAADIRLPVNSEGEATLYALLDEAQMIARETGQ